MENRPMLAGLNAGQDKTKTKRIECEKNIFMDGIATRIEGVCR